MRRRLKAKAAVDPVAAVDWDEVAASLDERGYATTSALLSVEVCHELVALYPTEDAFRRRVIMQHHAYGRGEYKYFRYPLPTTVDGLRQAIYPHLAPIANRWRERLREDGRFPPSLGAYLAQCHAAGQERPTPLLLKYETGDYNCLHQDLYGEHVLSIPCSSHSTRWKCSAEPWRTIFPVGASIAFPTASLKSSLKSVGTDQNGHRLAG